VISSAMAIPDREGIDPKKKEPRFNKILGGKQIGLIKRGMKRLFMLAVVLTMRDVPESGGGIVRGSPESR
jgi:hypothetical protein